MKESDPGFSTLLVDFVVACCFKLNPPHKSFDEGYKCSCMVSPGCGHDDARCIVGGEQEWRCSAAGHPGNRPLEEVVLEEL